MPPLSSRHGWLPLAGALHVAEEGLCGWMTWIHAFSPGITWPEFVVWNALFLAFLMALPLVPPRWPALRLAGPCLLLVNLPVHLVPTLWTGLWSPGLGTALLLYAPLGTWALRNAWRQGARTPVFLKGTALALAAMTLPVLFHLAGLAMTT